MIAASDFWSIAETVSFMVIVNQSLSFALKVRDGATNRDFTGAARLAPAMALALDRLSAHSAVHLLGQ